MNNVKNSIEWADYTVNPVKGMCPMACSYCYARRIYQRLKLNPEISFNPSWYKNIDQLKKPARIFVGSTMELFGEWVKPEWMEDIFEKVSYFNQHTFIFLTKRPERLYDYNPYPKNAWIGVSLPNRNLMPKAFGCLSILHPTVKFLSFEPLIDDVAQYDWFDHLINDIGWVIIGRQTPISKATAPQIEWVRKIVDTADEFGKPVFLKKKIEGIFFPEKETNPQINNGYLLPSWAGKMTSDNRRVLRQEFPVPVPSPVEVC